MPDIWLWSMPCMSPVAAIAEETVRPVSAKARRVERINLVMGSASFFHANFTEHAHFHVIKEMAVIGPAAERVGGDPVAAL